MFDPLFIAITREPDAELKTIDTSKLSLYCRVWKSKVALL